MTIDALPTAPSRSDTPAVFITNADAFVAALPTMVTQVNSATLALNLNATSDTSSTSNSISTGAKTFTVSVSKSFLGGMFIVIADTAAPSTNSMIAQVTSYNSGTGELVVDVKGVLGSGTKTAWTISQTTNPIPLDLSVSLAKLVANIFSGATIVTFDADTDYIVMSDVSDSGNTKKALIPPASQTVKGVVELATAAEIKTGTDAARTMAPDQLLSALGFSARYNSGNQTITSGGALTLAHGLGREPIIVQAWLECTTADAGYSIGDKLKAPETAEQGISRGLSIVADSTNVTVRFGSDANPFVILNKGTGVITTAVNASWRLVIEALA